MIGLKETLGKAFCSLCIAGTGSYLSPLLQTSTSSQKCQLACGHPGPHSQIQQWDCKGERFKQGFLTEKATCPSIGFPFCCGCCGNSEHGFSAALPATLAAFSSSRQSVSLFIQFIATLVPNLARETHELLITRLWWFVETSSSVLCLHWSLRIESNVGKWRIKPGVSSAGRKKMEFVNHYWKSLSLPRLKSSAGSKW